MFYPIDQKIRRPDIRVFEKALATAFGGKGVTTHNAEQAAMKAVIDRFVALGYKPADLPGLLHVISQESQGLLAWGQWVNDGKRLIGVSAKLTEALHLSDCGELIISDVLPGAGHDHRGHFMCASLGYTESDFRMAMCPSRALTSSLGMGRFASCSVVPCLRRHWPMSAGRSAMTFGPRSPCTPCLYAKPSKKHWTSIFRTSQTIKQGCPKTPIGLQQISLRTGCHKIMPAGARRSS